MPLRSQPVMRPVEGPADDASPDIGNTKNRIDSLRADLERRSDAVEKTMHTLNRCIDYRIAVMNVFAYATDKIRNENDPAVRPYVDKLRTRYAESRHEKQISDRKRALETCTKELP